MEQRITHIRLHNVDPRCAFGVLFVRISKEDECWQSLKLLTRFSHACIEKHSFLQVCRAVMRPLSQLDVTRYGRLLDIDSVLYTKDVANLNLHAVPGVFIALEVGSRQ